MPWQNTEPMEQKILFINRALGVGRGEFSGLCREFGISRKTGYKWCRRYREARSLGGLAERSRRPRRSPRRIEVSVEEAILRLREPDGWGARKIAFLLWEQGVSVSVATVHRTLLRHGRVHRMDQHSPALRRFERPRPNDLVQADFKGPMGRGGVRDEPLTVLDDHSRFALGVFALRDHSSGRVRDCFEQVFQRYGLPRQLLLDHGVPWWNNRNGWGLSRLSVFLMQQGIDLIFSRVGHPQTQGKIERFHRTLGRSMTHQGVPTRWEQWQQRYDRFLERYNHQRPHEALGMERPAQRYQASGRSYTGRVPHWSYPGSLEERVVDAAGTLRVGGRRYFVCEALAHQTVALEWVGEHGLVRFRHMYVREIDLARQRTLPFVYPVSEVADHLLPMS